VSVFAELGIGQRLVAAAAALGWTDALPIQRAAIPVLRRGGNVVLRASTGAGVTGAYGLPLLDRLAETERAGEGVRVLVVVATETRAGTVAAILARLAGGEVRVRALLPGWHDATVADVLVATPAAAAAAVETSRLKLGALDALVLEGAHTLIEPGRAAALEKLLVSVPPEAQRVITTAALSREVDRFAEAHARRAMSIPARPADPQEAGRVQARGTVSYMLVPDRAKQLTLARLLEDGAHRTVVVRDARRVEEVSDVLRERGYLQGPSGGSTEVVRFGNAAAAHATVAYDVPPDGDAFMGLDQSGVTVLVTPPELPHLRAVAEDVGITLKSTPAPRDPNAAVGSFRDEIRRALREEDTDAQLLLLEPVFEEYAPAEVAAALSALLRRKQPPREKAESTADAAAAGRGRPFVRLFVSVGQKDGLRPAEVVGTFTSEAGIAGEQVGKIEIRDTFTVVEVDAAVAERVIRALNGTTIRGRSVRIDYDRKTPAPGPRRSPRPAS
jgi:ATP-dependent RNA helicase DeaD